MKDQSEAEAIAVASVPTAPARLALPELVFMEKHRIGRRFCILAEAQDIEIEATSDYSISSRRKIPLHHLSSGEIIAVAEKTLEDIPPDVTGVLVVPRGGKPRWQWHAKQAAFATRFQADPAAVVSDIAASWVGAFRFKTEVADADGRVAPGDEGLRPPQEGGLYAIGMHWSVSANEPATVVMPTGTGKTETMLCAVVNFRPGPTLIAVPSDALRLQTAVKFGTLGRLRSLGLVDHGIHNPVVAVVTKEAVTSADLEFLRGCNIIIGVMASLGGRVTASLLPELASFVKCLFVDEAHHVPSDTWREFRERFAGRRIVQFTATPFRLDGKLVDGRVIFGYSLSAAQRDGYFKPIKFVPVYQMDPDKLDLDMAEAGLEALHADLAAGLNHLLMARCSRIARGADLLEIYRKLAPELKPTLVHSEMSLGEIARILGELRAGRSRVVICVNMLGEGFDLPELKVAVLHDLHKSLPVLLQFTGRFTRSSGSRIGDATVVANISDPKVSGKLERLYSENADWNQLLSEASSVAAREHAELIAFLRDSTALVPEDDVGEQRISKNLLRPKFSTIVYHCKEFTPKNFHVGLPLDIIVHAAWHNEREALLYFVCRREERVRWSSGKKLADRTWHLFVLHHDAEAGLLHVNSSDKDSLHEPLARAVGATEKIDGEKTFRSLGGIQRLIFSNIGVRKHGRRNMSFAMYTGAQVQQALTITETAGSTKSNLDGRGWEGGDVVAPGCSAKGRVWSKAQGTIPKWVRWCRPVGRKLVDDTIDVSKILKNVLIPREIEDFPEEQVLSVEWPPETLRTSDDRIHVVKDGVQIPLAFCEWVHEPDKSSTKRLAFRLVSLNGELNEDFSLAIDASQGYRFAGAERLRFKQGRRDEALVDYLNDYPLVIRYVSLKELEGDLLYEHGDERPPQIEARELVTWDWTGVDLMVESTWKGGVERKDSIQTHAASHYVADGYDIVFNDDDAGEAADLICIKEFDDHIRLALVHCKYSDAAKPGQRVKDVVEVSSQAVRSASWRGNLERLHRHMLARYKHVGSGGPARDRMIFGTMHVLTNLVRAAKMKAVRFEIVIVQPGLQRSGLTDDQAIVLGSAKAYLKQTVDVDLEIICSA